MCSSDKIKIRKINPHRSDDLLISAMKKIKNKKKKKKKKTTTHHRHSPKPAPPKKTARTRSLRQELSKPIINNSLDYSRDHHQSIMINNNSENQQQQNYDQQLSLLFPNLHPAENLLEADGDDDQKDGLHHDDENNDMACFFDTSTDDHSRASTLNGLFWVSEGGGGGAQCSSEEADSILSSSTLTYAYNQGRQSDDQLLGGAGEDQSSSSLQLVRTALRHKERDDHENHHQEKWVCYSEVVEKTMKEEDLVVVVSSTCTSSLPGRPDDHDYSRGYHRDHHHLNQNQDLNQIQRLSLKLDYQEIMNAWSDKAPLYIGDSSGLQIVPDILDDLRAQDTTNNVLGDAGSLLWGVPDHHVDGSSSGNIIDGREDQAGMKMMMEEREARVLRYKEKRQSRLFAKRIRYEVRKLNAEKRPRMKGRFVKRN